MSARVLDAAECGLICECGSISRMRFNSARMRSVKACDMDCSLRAPACGGYTTQGPSRQSQVVPAGFRGARLRERVIHPASPVLPLPTHGQVEKLPHEPDASSTHTIDVACASPVCWLVPEHFFFSPKATIMRRGLWLVLAFCCLVSFSLPGCGAGSAGEPKIVILTNGSSPFWDACDRGLKDAGQKLGVRVELVRNDATEGGQIRRLEQLATQSDVKGVGVSVVEEQAAGVLERMQALRAKGVKVITVDSDGKPEGREAFVGTNNLEAGRELGRLVAQLRPDGGKAVAFVGILGAQNAQERIQGLKEGLGDKI